jgi:hypothetical protein
MVWYILLASVRGFRMSKDAMRRSPRKRSAFWDGGSGGGERRTMFHIKLKHARKKRMGRMVKV